MTLALVVAVAQATTPAAEAATSVVTVGASADAMVTEEHPTWTYGSDRLLRSLGRSGRRAESYVRFTVPAQNGRIVGAKLRLRAYSNTVDGPLVSLASSRWSESSIDWSSRPGSSGSTLANSDAITAGSWTEWIVTPAVTAAGTYSFRLAGSSSDDVYFHSRQASTASYRPQLALTVETTPPPDVTAPTVALTGPVAGTTVSGLVAATATASDNVGVTRVVFSVDGVAVGTDTVAPFASTFDADTLSTGSHVVSARAHDAAGNASAAGSATVQKAPPVDRTLPTVALTAPVAGTTVSGQVVATATAGDNVGVTSVVFSVDGLAVATDTAAPFSATFDADALPTGSHVVRAQAYDAAGNTAYAVAAVEKAPPPDTTAPTVGLTAPVAGTTVSGQVVASANATDNVDVTRVVFSVDGVVVGTDLAAPFATSFTADTLATGSHVVAAQAYDAAGNVSPVSSAAVQKAAPADLTPPTVALQVARGTGEFLVTANAADDVGVVRVVFSLDDVEHSTDTSAPYGLVLPEASLLPGSHVVTARAYDAAGNGSSVGTVGFEVTARDVGQGNDQPGGLRTVPDPTFWVSPNGGGTGRSESSPTTLANAESQVQPGDVVFLKPGEYLFSNTMVIRRSGTESAPIWWTSDGDAWLRWNNNSVNNDFIQIEANGGRHHRGFDRLNFDGETKEGRRYGNNAIFARNGSHHIWLQQSYTKRLSGASFASHESDYLEVLYNRFWLGGDLARSASPGPAGPSWTSFVSFNNAPGVLRHDAFAGFHNFIVGNIGAGQVDRSGSSSSGYMTDGNFIILDRGGPAPATLIMNNLGYMSGGRCISPFLYGNGWVVNNTCYKNTLMNDTFSSNIDEYWGNESDTHYVNNIGAAWTSQRAFSHNGDTTRVTFQRNLFVPNGGAGNVIPSGQESPFNLAPMFLAPPSVPSSGQDLYKTAPDPRGITDEFQLAVNSPARDTGIDPRTANGMTTDLRKGLERFAGNDLAGNPRPPAGQTGWSVGAYER